MLFFRHFFDSSKKFSRAVQACLLLALWTSSTGCKEGDIDDFFGVGTDEEPETTIGNSALTFSPKDHNFGNLPPFPAFSEEEIIITNDSNETITIGNISGENANFTIKDNSCPDTLDAKASCQLTVRFSPVSGGNHSMSLVALYGTSESENTTFFASTNFLGSSNADAPSNYELTSVTASQMTFSWTDNASNETGYEIQLCQGSNCDSNFIAIAEESIAADSTSHTMTGLTEGEFYTARIRATSPGANSNWLFGSRALTFGGIQSVDNGGKVASFISQIDCSTHSGVYVGLKWNHIANAASYSIYELDGNNSSLVANVGAVDNYLIPSLATGISKTYRVVANTGDGLSSKNIANDTRLTTSGFAPCVTLGQEDSTKLGLSATFYSPYSTWTDNNKLIVADQSNHRVLIWNSMPATSTTAPDVVLGQPDLDTNTLNNGGRSSKSLYNPRGVFSDGTKLYVADYSNHRVLIWNTIPTSNFKEADVVVGQSNFSAGGGAISSSRFNGPSAIYVAGGKLFVVDTSNNRVVVFNSVPTSNGAVADVTIGQSSFTAKATTCNQSTLRTPRDIWTDGTKVVVSAYDQQRVLIWNTVPTSNGTNADVVVGQTSFTSCNKNIANSNTVIANGLFRPWGVASDGTNLYIADYQNNRVVYHNVLPTTNGRNADGVYGPANLTSNNGGVTNLRLNRPSDLFLAGGDLWTADTTNHRILQRSPSPVAVGGETHTLVLGKEDFTVNGANRPSPTGADSFYSPGQTATDGTHFAVADSTNNRVLIWNTIPTSHKQTADIVLGQPDFTTTTRDNGNGDQRLDGPYGVAFHGGKLYVADSTNNRVLIWNNIPTTNHAAADLVIGQTTFTSYSHNNAANRMRYPTSIHFSDDDRMIITERDNNRVTVWDTPPTATGASADWVVGQTAFGTSGAARTQNRIDGPWTATTMGNALLVTERDNNRVMIWNTIPSANGANADVVLGQDLFTTNTADNGGLSEASLDQPFGMVAAGGKLYVAEYDNQRILIWNSLPTTNKQAADAVFGQAAFNTSTANNGGVAFNRLFNPRHLASDGTRLFISDAGNHRVSILPLP